MTPNFEQAIEIVKALPKDEREKVRKWLDEHQDEPQNSIDDEKFRRALKWIEDHKEEFDGQWVCLDGDKLIAHGKDAKSVYDEARAKGISTPFMERVKAKVLPWGGW